MTIHVPGICCFLAFWPLLGVLDQKATLPSKFQPPFIFYKKLHVSNSSRYGCLNVLSCCVIAVTIHVPGVCCFLAFWRPYCVNVPHPQHIQHGCFVTSNQNASN
jgi:hypothetical protein